VIVRWRDVEVFSFLCSAPVLLQFTIEIEISYLYLVDAGDARRYTKTRNRTVEERG
jgi:hypothetical protein